MTAPTTMTEEYSKVFDVCKELYEARQYVLVEQCRDTWHLKGRPPTGGSLVHLFIITHSKLNVDLIKYYYTMFCDKGIKHAILVYQNSVTSSVKKILQSIEIHIELFCISELKYNILKHTLVPKHTKIATAKNNDQKYPIMKRTDPVARFIGFRHGDVIQIDRRDGSVYFRFVR